jgi:hypothetical protein
VPFLARAWILAARARGRLAGLTRGPRSEHRRAPREELVRRYAPGRSFADIGCMWNVDGAISFLAEEMGASSVTGLDLMPATPAFRAHQRARSSSVRFLQGDLHDEHVIAAVGRHDVVWCSGVLYHAPHPLLTLKRLRSIVGELLILATETIPEVPGLRQACVFLPALPDADRRAHAAARPGVTAAGLSEPFDRAQAYGAWWWAISRSALHAMLTLSGFQAIEEYGDSLHATIVARAV